MARAVKAEDVQPEAVEWLWRGRIPKGMISIVAGRPDQGKGLLAARVAADVSQPEPVAELTATNVRVLYSAAEDSHGLMTRPRLEAADAVLENILLWRFRLPLQFNELADIIVKHDIGLVVMDPMASHLSGGISRHSDNVREVLNPLTELIEKTGTAVLIVEHALKRAPTSGHVMGVIGGSGSGLVAAARAAYVFGVDPDDEDKRVLAPAKLNIAERPPALSFDVDIEDIAEVGDIPALVYDDELVSFDPMRLFTNDGPGGKRGVGRPPDKRAAAAEWLTVYLGENGPTQAGLIIEDAKQRGMAIKTLRRAAEDMKIVKNPPGGGRNCVWDLPDEVKDLLGIAHGGDDEGSATGGTDPEPPSGPGEEANVDWSVLEEAFQTDLPDEEDGESSEG